MSVLRLGGRRAKRGMYCMEWATLFLGRTSRRTLILYILEMSSDSGCASAPKYPVPTELRGVK